MSTKRMTGIDYRKEWRANQQAQKSLKAHVKTRLLELMKKYPDATIDFNSTAKEFREEWLENMSSFGMIKYIEIIEAWSAEQSPVVQTKIKL